MSTYAKINSENIVENVIIADAAYVASQGGIWIEVTESTRKANTGDTYSAEKNKFISEKTFESWVLDEESCEWVSPVGPKPANGHWYWNEPEQEWTEIISEVSE